MSKFIESTTPTETPQEETDILGMMRKLQQHMIFLEKKIDTLIAQSAEKASFKPRHFDNNRPPRSFDRPRRHGHGGGDRGPRPFGPPQGEGSGERRFGSHGHGGGDRRPRPFPPRQSEGSGAPHAGGGSSFARRKPHWKKDRH